MIEIPDRADFRTFAAKNRASGYKALGFAYSSYQIRRSTNSCTILLLGSTGAGKSHTINNILGTTVTPVGDKKSCTSDINEFTIEMPSKDLGISNSKLHVVDTPGFGDVQGGLQFDATVLANIHQLFEKRNYLPNIILLAVNMNDERLDGEFSSFVKLLKAIKIQLTGSVLDKDHSNLIVVLTHLCGAIPKLQRDTDGKKSLIKKIVAENLGISDIPVEVAENCWDEYELQKKKDNVLLPNKELFPRNIYLGMVKIVKAIDPVGHGIINEACRMLQKQKPAILHTKHPVMEIPQTREIGDDIIRMQISSNTELGDRLVQTWSHFSQDEKNDFRLQPTLLGLKLSNMGYEKADDIPRSKQDLMRFYRELGTNKGMEILLRKAVGVEAPRFQLDLLIGRVFDITRDKITSFNLFIPESERLTTIGCYLPNHVQASIFPEILPSFTCNVLQSSADMVQQRLKQLKINISIGNIGFKYDSRNGFNITSQSSSNKLTAVYEKRLIKLERDHHNSAISAELKSAVENLPKTYNKHDANNVLKWKNFFSTYGTHYVMSSYIGGSVVFEIANVNSMSSSSNFNIQSGGFSDFLDLLFGGGSYSKSSSSSFSSSSTQRDFNIIVQGGDSTKASALADSQNQLQFSDRLKEWEETIWDNPMVTDLSITLGEVSDVVNCIQPSVVNAMKNATVDLYHARLEYEPQTQKTLLPASKEKLANKCILQNTSLHFEKHFIGV